MSGCNLKNKVPDALYSENTVPNIDVKNINIISDFVFLWFCNKRFYGLAISVSSMLQLDEVLYRYYRKLVDK
jgi:hypothetical protein